MFFPLMLGNRFAPEFSFTGVFNSKKQLLIFRGVIGKNLKLSMHSVGRKSNLLNVPSAGTRTILNFPMKSTAF